MAGVTRFCPRWSRGGRDVAESEQRRANQAPRTQTEQASVSGRRQLLSAPCGSSAPPGEEAKRNKASSRDRRSARCSCFPPSTRPAPSRSLLAPQPQPGAAMGLTISSLFSRLFGKKQMRILMGERPRRRFRTPRSLPSWAQIRAARGDPTPAITGGPARRSGDRAAPHRARVPPRSGGCLLPAAWRGFERLL